MNDEQYAALELDVKPRLTPAFLSTLVQAARIYGNEGDWPAVLDFVRNCHRIAGVDMPSSVEPYA